MLPGLSLDRLASLFAGMSESWQRSENMMQWARHEFLTKAELDDPQVAALVVEIAYDLQSGSYMTRAKERPDLAEEWGLCLSAELSEHLESGFSLLEVGVGEATTLDQILLNLKNQPRLVAGSDFSFARLTLASQNLDAQGLKASFFLADMFNMPLEDDSFDLVFTSHALESNRGREKEAISELLRVSRHKVVMVEPGYEFAERAAQARMDEHGYVTGLRDAAEELGAIVRKHAELPFSVNPKNPSAILVLEKASSEHNPGFPPVDLGIPYRCPVTTQSLKVTADDLMRSRNGYSYPVLRGIPLLHPRFRLFEPDQSQLGA